LHCLKMIGMTVCDNSHIDLVRGDVESSKTLLHISEEMPMTGIYEDFQFAINKVGIAVILRIDPPYKGVETINYFHEVILLSIFRSDPLKFTYPQNSILRLTCGSKILPSDSKVSLYGELRNMDGRVLMA